LRIPDTEAVLPVPVTVAVLNILSPFHILATAVVVESGFMFITVNARDCPGVATYVVSQTLPWLPREEVPPDISVHVKLYRFPVPSGSKVMRYSQQQLISASAS